MGNIRKQINIFTFIIAVIFLNFGFNAQAADTLSDTFYFEYLDLKKGNNGFATQNFELHTDGIQFDSLAVYYRICDDKTSYRAEINDNIVTILIYHLSYLVE